jgi:hypothetical protein
MEHMMLILRIFFVLNNNVHITGLVIDETYNTTAAYWLNDDEMILYEYYSIAYSIYVVPFS